MLKLNLIGLIKLLLAISFYFRVTYIFKSDKSFKTWIGHPTSCTTQLIVVYYFIVMYLAKFAFLILVF